MGLVYWCCKDEHRSVLHFVKIHVLFRSQYFILGHILLLEHNFIFCGAVTLIYPEVQNVPWCFVHWCMLKCCLTAVIRYLASDLTYTFPICLTSTPVWNHCNITVVFHVVVYVVGLMSALGQNVETISQFLTMLNANTNSPYGVHGQPHFGEVAFISFICLISVMSVVRRWTLIENVGVVDVRVNICFCWDAVQ